MVMALICLFLVVFLALFFLNCFPFSHTAKEAEIKLQKHSKDFEEILFFMTDYLKDLHGIKINEVKKDIEHMRLLTKRGKGKVEAEMIMAIERDVAVLKRIATEHLLYDVRLELRYLSTQSEKLPEDVKVCYEELSKETESVRNSFKKGQAESAELVVLKNKLDRLMTTLAEGSVKEPD